MILKFSSCTTLVGTVILFFCSNSWAANPLDTLKSLHSSSLLVVDSQNQILQSKNADQLLIPASTIKVLTALIALDHWGKEYRFITDFYLDSSSNYLWIKGYGDPYLISEELDLIVAKLKQFGVNSISGIGVNNSYFDKTIIIDGQENTNNPYDAPVSAVAANFNTVNVRIKNKIITSAETQTPLTPIARKLSQGLPAGTHRINLGEAELGPKYFSELLMAKLHGSDIPTGANFIHSNIPASSEHLFTHKNSHTLEQMIKSMLEYSNNFIANQLYLALGAQIYGVPASMEKSRSVVADFIIQNFNWQKYILVEGAGLSMRNRLSARQLMDVLKKFKPYRWLMPAQNSHILAKSGTLKNVSTYAGYLNHNNQWSPFALMINQKVNYTFREQVALELLNSK